MKKLIAFIFAALFASSGFADTERFYADEIVGELRYYYYAENGEATITDAWPVSECYDDNLIVPSTLGGCQVTAIDGSYTTLIDGKECWFGAFSGLPSCSVRLPVGLEKIGWCAFAGSWLQSVSFPDELETIGVSAFEGCCSLQSVTIPKNVKVIWDHAFEGCESLQSVSIPESVQAIGDSAFFGCTSLESVIIPNGLKVIEKFVFGGTSLHSIVIPESVTEIGEGAFGCSLLESVIFSKGLRSIGVGAFTGCCSLETVTLPDGLETIGGDAFSGCTSLQTVTIPKSVNVIGMYAFGWCESLQSIALPNGLKQLDGCVFADCVSLRSLTIPSGVVSIGDFAFYNCNSLESITIPSSVIEIGMDAFRNCNSLKTIYVDKVDADRVKELMSGKGVDVDKLKFVERGDIPVIAGDDWAEVTGDAESGFVVKPSAETTDVVITIPEGVAAEKVTVEVSPTVQTVKANGATIRVVKGEADITEFLAIPAAVDGVVNLGAAEVKEEIVKETLDPEQGAEIELSSEEPTLTTAETKPGLTYTLVEGTTLESMANGDSMVGDGQPWSPNITVKGGNSGFYTIKVTK